MFPEQKLQLEEIHRSERSTADTLATCEKMIGELIDWRKSKAGKERLAKNKAILQANAKHWSAIDPLVVALRTHMFEEGEDGKEAAQEELLL
jgi:hypothetical protein